MSMWSVFRPLLFLLDAELAHNMACGLMAFFSRTAPFLLRCISGSEADSGDEGPHFLGIKFRNPIGLAAGFDKNAKLVHAADLLGFGFIEIGTVTLKAQAGNPKPRLFRRKREAALVNRMGFNNRGATEVLERLKASRPKLSKNFRVGVNIGLNKDCPHDRAAHDYADLAKRFEVVADYLVVNVSSPNTPGLRALQSKENLLRIFSSIRDSLKASETPVLLKLAPEIEGEELQEIILSLEEKNLIHGVVLTNTIGVEIEQGAAGLSGGPLKAISRERLRELRRFSKLPCISVGGIDSRAEFKMRIEEGADLVQVYSAWVFSGPRLVSKMLAP